MPGQPQFIALLDEWNLSTDPPDTTFAVPVPAGYKRIDLQPAASPATAPVRPLTKRTARCCPVRGDAIVAG